MADIKLFVCCHQPVTVPKHPLLFPVQVGAALAEARFPGFAYDDEGDNISAKNRSYCELTAQYWAWKNVEADYYGFFHYRRYLYPSVSVKQPYRIEREPDEATLNKLGYSRFDKLICQYDLIIPKGEDMHVSVREHYAAAPNHQAKDLALIEEIVADRHPQMVTAMDEYLRGTVNYFGNIYIMRRPVFEDYCAWLFPILEEFDRRADLTGYNAQALRVDGYQAERLLGVYYAHRRAHLRTLELPRVHFHSGWDYAKRQALSFLFPPGTLQRAIVKAARRRIG